MATPGAPFDWRAFWADLLQGTGRALLTLDGSDVAQAALTGLDYFDAAQNRRAEWQEAGDEDREDPLEAAQDRVANVRVAPAWRRYDPGTEGYVQLASGPYSPAFASSSGFMMPGRRPQPMSANSYDSIELPAQVSFSSTRLPIIRGR